MKPEEISTRMLDITQPEHVELTVDFDRGIVYANVDGVCALRTCLCKNVDIQLIGGHQIPVSELSGEFEKRAQQAITMKRSSRNAGDQDRLDTEARVWREAANYIRLSHHVTKST